MDNAQSGSYHLLDKDEDGYSLDEPNQNSVSIRSTRSLRTMWPYFTIIVLLCIIFWLSRRPSPVDRCGLQSDVLFGDLPYHPVLIENDENFLTSDPFGGNETTVWDDIFTGTWVSFPDPSTGGIAGHGMRMRDVAADPSAWAENSEGYGIAVMHQLHCVMTIKSTMLDLERGEILSPADHAHTHHCIEILRQVVTCHSDLTLEHPEPNSNGRYELSGWGNLHYCRDFSSVVKAVRKATIARSPQGWIPLGV